MTAAAWWSRAMKQWKSRPTDRQWRDVESFSSLSTHDRFKIERRSNEGLKSEDPAVRAIAFKVIEDIVVNEWG